MESQTVLFWVVFGVIALLVAMIWLAFSQWRARRALASLPETLAASMAQAQSEQHRQMLLDLGDRLARQGDRVATSQSEAADRLRTAVAGELDKTRASLHTLQLQQGEHLASNRETLIQQLSALTQNLSKGQDQLKTELLTRTLEKLAEQSRAEQQLIQTTMQNVTTQVTTAIEALARANDTRLAEISGRVNERLDEGFKKTNETFVNVMARLATIDEAQKKIDGLTTNVVSLQQLLGDKRSRGAFGEVQLETIIRNVMPASVYEFQYTFSKGVRADCVLKLPAPTGVVAIDSKFPLENYDRMLESAAEKSPSNVAANAFKTDVRRHIDDISTRYIIPGETGDGAMMFLPAEAVFAEIHAHHRDLVEYAARRRVWLVSPTTMMAVLNTALAVIKDVETRKQVHVIKDSLSKLGADFGRFQSRMDDLAKHIGQVSKDVEQVHTSSRKISEQFQKIERVEIASPALSSDTEAKPVLAVVRPANDS